jgi:hypothetical protein
MGFLLMSETNGKDMEDLPPIGGSYERPKTKSTDRHKRETAFKIADSLQLSVTTLRRVHFIKKFGSPEIQQALRDEKISISRAFNIVKAEDEERGRLFLRDLLKLPEAERGQPLTNLRMNWQRQKAGDIV